MLAKGQTIIQWIDQLAPKHYALPDDKIGLQLGSLNKEINHVLIALDVTDEVVEEAIEAGVDLIIAHHAIIYRPLQQLRTDTPAGKLYEKLIKHDIAVYIAHTNLDVAEGGVNDLLAESLKLDDLKSLDLLPGENLGIGRVGKLAEDKPLGELAEQVKEVFNVPTVRVVGELNRSIKKVAVVGGSGSRYVHHALFAGADVLITGDIDYHTAHDAIAAGLAIIDPGHNIEKILKEPLAAYLLEKLQAKKHSTRVSASKVDTEPFVFI